ncbi:hypothetical protein [Klebsiella sp. K-Nf6]|uniref:hypothetical protein n=1 Tax=Klebsiella sp. K-Nf6 TaxID=2054595 RepID=UPI000C294FA1|nr:hypothetical protein [Klebsiella sp. K-Nf6]PJR63484.1 hypothetical protein CWM61_14685 [Klebsiella sp. K-Nf6]
MFIENKPDEIELLSFFESEPVSFERDNISFLYTAKNKCGLSVDFSFSVVEGWIQCTVRLHENEILHNSIDGVSSFSIRNDNLGDYIYAEILTKELINKVEIRIRPDIKIKSSSVIR